MGPRHSASHCESAGILPHALRCEPNVAARVKRLFATAACLMSETPRLTKRRISPYNHGGSDSGTPVTPRGGGGGINEHERTSLCLVTTRSPTTQTLCNSNVIHVRRSTVAQFRERPAHLAGLCSHVGRSQQQMAEITLFIKSSLHATACWGTAGSAGHFSGKCEMLSFYTVQVGLMDPPEPP